MQPANIAARDRLIFALDLPSIAAAEAMISRLGDSVNFYKIGYQLAYAGGLPLARQLADKGKKVFVDLKLHDIGNTVVLGVDGLVCSPDEAASLHKIVGHQMVLVTPGIRPAGTSTGDQKRIMTPARAISAGADYLVIGRPVMEAGDPKAAVEAIQAEIAQAIV